jgi:hypothetical protein
MFKKLDCCKYCNFSFLELNTNQRANHSRWCKMNPKRKEYSDKLIDARLRIKNPRNQYVKAKDEGRVIPVAPNKGKPGYFLGKKHSDDTKNIIKQKALASPHRRLIRSIKEYKCKDNSTVMLDSSWEVALAKRLDKLNVSWIRPKTPMIWIDSKGQSRHYFPDFYLPEYDLYLDPKNPLAIKAQEEKVNWLIVNVKNLRFLKSLNECNTFTL